jgi:protein-tyrosine phosphatase
MIDLHHHLLPGLDDGSPDLETSVAMARMASADGITHIVCTPHASGRYTFTPEIVAAKLTELRAAVAAESIDIILGGGCDFHLNYDNIQDAISHPTRYTVNGKNYLMVELPDFGLSPNLGETFYEFQRAGITSVLTHPERNPTLQKDPKRLEEWMRNGLLLQVTTSSVTGKMGKDAERMAHKLLADRWVHVLATDAHNLTSRPPQMSQAREVVAKRYGADYAQLLCVDNPLAIFEGHHLADQEEPRHLFDTFDTIDTGRKSWWKRMFGK